LALKIETKNSLKKLTKIPTKTPFPYRKSTYIYIQEYLKKIPTFHKGDKVYELVDTASTLSILIIHLGPSHPAEYFLSLVINRLNKFCPKFDK